MTLSRREKIMIIVGLTVVSVVAYAFYFLIPYVNNSASANSELAKTNSEINLLQMQQGMTGQLEEEIASLTGQIGDLGDAMPTGIDDARILLYLKGLTQGRAVDINIGVTGSPELKDYFLQQAVVLDFRTSYPLLLQIIADLKKNELYSRVTFFKAEYRQIADETELGTDPPVTVEPTEASGTVAAGTAEPATPTPLPTATPTPAPTATPDVNVIAVHIELSFYGLQTDADHVEELPLPPAPGSNGENLFPLE